MTSRVIEIRSFEEYLAIFAKSNDKLVVVDFSAKWCRPCVQIAPVYAELSWKYPDVVFLKVDVDEVKEIARGAGVSAMPTFQFYRNNNKVAEFAGASPQKLEAMIVQYKPSAEPTLQQLVASGQDLSELLTDAVRKVYETTSKNNADAALDTINTLLLNVVNDPSNQKFRRIRIENARFHQQVWSIPASQRILRFAGFKEDIEHGFLILPANADLEALYVLQALISSRNDSGSTLVPSTSQSTSSNRQPRGQASPQSANPVPAPAAGAPGSLSQQDAMALALSLAASLAAAAQQQQAQSPQQVLSQSRPQSQPQAQQSTSSMIGRQNDLFSMLQRRYLELEKASLTEGEKEKDFLGRLRSYQNQVMLYERPDYQKKALALIPVAALQEKSKNLIFQGADPKEELIKQLLRWFKFEFFTWTDKAKCQVCQGPTIAQGSVPPSATELQYGGNRVELYYCEKCKVATRFPRYNDPSKLLETRTGRCGEWANCFTLCCRALGYQARFVVDWTDHVWTEVYNEKQKRWVHCDPSEPVHDKPLIYEAGWGKKLSYIIAFSCDEVVDVTRKYTTNLKEVMSRRNEVKHRYLKYAIALLCVELRGKQSADKIDEIGKRYIEEWTAVCKKPQVKEDEKIGRQSGSEEWRRQRGELGSTSHDQSSFVSELSPSSMALIRQLKTPVFDLSSLDGPSQLVFLGCAQVANNTPNHVILTPKQNDQLGGVFLNRKVGLKGGFVFDFSFAVKEPGADGFAIVIHNSGSGGRELGKGGAELGYGGLKNSVAIEFDTYENSDRTEDPNDNHISIHTRGVEANEAHHSASIACTKYNDIPSLKTGNPIHIRIIYNPEAPQLAIQLTDDMNADYVTVLTASVSLDQLIRLDEEGKAWIGFTGATGGLSQLQVIYAWKLFLL